MRLVLSVLVVLAACCMHTNDAQFNGMGRFFGNFMGMFKPFQAMFGGFQQKPTNQFGVVGGTEGPTATGRDELNPADCGRDKKTGKGSLCFPDGLLCEQSKTISNLTMRKRFTAEHSLSVEPPRETRLRANC